MKRHHVFEMFFFLAISLMASTVLSAQTPTDHDSCQVTLRPETAFSPPFPYLLRPPDPVSFWYGTSALWTQLWAPPPWTPWKPQEVARMYWASAEQSDDEQPALVVTIARLDADAPPFVFAAPETVSYTPKRFGMIASVTFPSAGCWQVTGQYHGKTLRYVVNVEPTTSPRNSSEESISQSSTRSFEPSLFGPETHPRSSIGVPRSSGRRILNCRFTGRAKAVDLPSVCDIACGGDLAPCTPKQLKKLHDNDLAQKERFTDARRLLLKHGVPFDPDILLEHAPRGAIESDWSLKPVLNQMPEMQQILWTDFLNGVVMADTIYVHGPVKVGPGPVIVIANHIVSETCPSFQTTTAGNKWGTNGFYLYILGPGRNLGISLDVALKRNGLNREQFPGKDHLPPFSIVRDLDLPKTSCGIDIHADAPAPIGPIPPQLWPDPPEQHKH